MTASMRPGSGDQIALAANPRSGRMTRGMVEPARPLAAPRPPRRWRAKVSCGWPVWSSPIVSLLDVAEESELFLGLGAKRLHLAGPGRLQYGLETTTSGGDPRLDGS